MTWGVGLISILALGVHPFNFPLATSMKVMEEA